MDLIYSLPHLEETFSVKNLRSTFKTWGKKLCLWISPRQYEFHCPLFSETGIPSR